MSLINIVNVLLPYLSLPGMTREKKDRIRPLSLYVTITGDKMK
jgi:hypothetical protein